MNPRTIIMATILTTLLLITPLSYAADVESSASITGKVTVTAATPTITFALYTDTNYNVTTTQITPQTPVYMKISVSGGNPLSEYVIDVQIFADTNNSKVGTPPATTSPETYVNFTISYNGTDWVLAANTGNSATWSITFDPTQQLPDPTAAAGDFYIEIIFGKTAREANTGDNVTYADWDIIATATVAGTASNNATAYGYTVFFYSEITALNTTIDFGTLEPNTNGTIQYVDNNPSDHFLVKIIANGYYDLKATSTPTWNTTDGYNITLTTTTPPGEGQFTLEADNDGNFTNGAAYVTTDVATANPFVDDAAPTTEDGALVSVYMRITLGNNIHTGTYQGTITVHVVDGA